MNNTDLILIAIVVILCIYLWSVHQAKQREVNRLAALEQFRHITATQVATGTVKTVKDLGAYGKQKWAELKIYLRKHYKEDMVRKMLKFLNYSTLVYLGKLQDEAIAAKDGLKLRKRKLRTNVDLLTQFCAEVKKNPNTAKQWLIKIISANFDDYLYEQWALKHTIWRAVLGLGENFGLMTGQDILNNYMLDIIDTDWPYILEALKNFENKAGVNVCTGKKTSILSRFF
jgi:hypothetical protein